ncbi:MAG: oxidoreductase [Salinarimonas sp.]|nr:oxidoreductase [Salinarimonas sp.]
MPRSPSTIAAAIHGYGVAVRVGVLCACLLVPALTAAPASAQLGQSISFVDADGTVVAELDREALEDIGRFEVSTRTPWDDGVVSFEGPLLRDLADAVGFDDAAIAVHALNDYSSEIPLSDMRDLDVILAVRKDGEYMPISDMGPAFVVYPYDSDARLRDRVYYARSVWQVARIQELPSGGE